MELESVAVLAEGFGIENCRSLEGSLVVTRILSSLGVAGRCRIEKGPGNCMGRYRRAGFDRRSSRVIHRNTQFTQFGAFVWKSMKGIVSPWG